MAYDPSRASPVKEPKAQSDITLDALLDEFEVSDPAVRDRVLRLAGVESSGNLNATGPRVNGGMHNGTRARGALQIMPATAKAYPQYDLNDPADASRAGLHYFLDNLNQFGGDLDAATIAHHAGPGTAKKWLREGRAGTVDRATGLSTDDYLLKIAGGKRAKPADKWWEGDPVAPAEAAGNWWESDPVEPAEEPGLLERGWSALKDTFSAPSGEPVDVRPHPGEQAPAATKLDSVMADYQGEQSARKTPANAQTRAFVQQQYDAHPEKREAMLSRPDWLGDIARQIDAEYQAMNPAESLKPFDQRREAKVARNRAQGMDPATAEMTTASQMIGGEAPVGSIKVSDFDFDLKQRYEGANPALRGAVKGYEGYKQGVLGFLQAGADLVGADFASGQFRRGAREAAGQAAAIGEGEAGARLFEGAVASLTQQLPLLIGGSIAGGQALILSGMAAQAFGQEYSEGRQAGLDGQDAAARASLFAAFEVIGEKFGLGNQLAALKMAYKGVPTKQLVAELGAALAKEIPGEVLTTTGQFLTDKAPQIGLNPEAGMAQYLSQVADTIGQTIIQGGLMMGGASAVSRGARAMQRPEPDLTAGLQFDPRVNDALARQALDPSNAQETADVAPPLDATSYQGPGADPAGGAGLASDGRVGAGGTGDAAGAPARSGEPGVSVGEAERQQVAGVVEQKIAEKEAEAAATGDPIEILVTRAEGAAMRRAVTPQPANGIDIDQDALLADVEAMFTDGGNLMVQGDNAREAVKRIDPKALASALPRGDGALLVPKRFAGPVMDALQGAKQRVSVAFGGDGMMQAPDVAQFRATVPTQEEVQDVPTSEQVDGKAQEARGQEGAASGKSAKVQTVSRQDFNVGGKDPHTISFEHKGDGRLIQTVAYPDGEVFTYTLVTDRAGDETWVSQSQYEKGEFYPRQLSSDETQAAISIALVGESATPVERQTQTPAAHGQKGAQETRDDLITQLENAEPISDEQLEIIGRLKDVTLADVNSMLSRGEMPVFRTGSDSLAVVTPSAKKSGKFQVTLYNSRGVFGDAEYDSIEVAIDDNVLDQAPMLSGAEAEQRLAQSLQAEAQYQARTQPTQAPTAPEQSRLAPAQTQAADKPKRQPPARKPDPVTVERAQRNAEDLRAMAQDAGWAEEGGKLLRDAEDNVSRTKWIPRAQWFLSGMESRPDVLAQHIEDAAQGKWIPVKSARTIEGMVEWLDAQRGQATLDEDASMYDFEAAGHDELSPPAQTVVDAFDDADPMTPQEEAEAMRALGFTEQEIQDAVGQTQASAGSVSEPVAAGAQEDGAGDQEAGRAQAEAGAEGPQELGVTYREGKGQAKGQWIATLEDGTEGNAKPTKEEALEDASRLARTKQANNQRKTEQTEALERAISKASLGGKLNDADLVAAGLTPNRDGSMDWLAFSQVVRQELGLTPRQLKPMVRGAIFEIQTPTGGQSERVDPRKALLEIAKSRASAEPLTLDTYTNADIAQREAEQTAQAEADARAEREVAAKQRQAEERAEVRRRSEAAADTFELGMDPMENLTGQGDIFSQPAPQTAPQEDGDWLMTLFGEDAGNVKEQMAQIERDEEQKEAAIHERIKALRGAMDSVRKDLQAQYDDWAGRVYKKNKNMVELQGDGPSSQAAISVGSLNENRRRRAMEALNDSLQAVGRLEKQITTDQGVKDMLRTLDRIMDRAKQLHESGNFTFLKSQDAAFEYILLDDALKMRPANGGSLTSNEISRATLAFMKQPTQTPKSPEQSSSIQRSESAQPTSSVVPAGVTLNQSQKAELAQGGSGMAGEIGEQTMRSLAAMRNNPNVPSPAQDAETGAYSPSDLPEFQDVGDGFSVRGYALRQRVVQEIKLPNGMIARRVLNADGTVYGEFEGDYDQIVGRKGFAEAEQYFRDFAKAKASHTTAPRALPSTPAQQGGLRFSRAGQPLESVKSAWRKAGIDFALQERGDVVTVSKIVVPEGAREAGAGTRAMEQLVAWADANGKHLALTPSADFGGNAKLLTAFYKRFGFKENKGKSRVLSVSESMIRENPNGKPLYSFAGQNARTADTMALDAAKARIEAGEDAEDVRQATGWFKGADGKWRFEISDADAKLRTEPSDPDTYADLFDEAASRSNGVPLGKVLDHPALFAAYPALQAVRVRVNENAKADGTYSATDNAIEIRDPYSYAGGLDTALSVLMHEIQHGIQNIEGFAKGGSLETAGVIKAQAKQEWDYWSSAYTVAREMVAGSAAEQAMDELNDLGFDINEDHVREALTRPIEELKAKNDAAEQELRRTGDGPRGTYQRIAGEVEARNTQARARMTDAERRATAPSATADVADADVIVVFNGTEMQNAPAPANAPKRFTRSALVQSISSRFPSLTRAVESALRRGDEGKPGGVVVVERAEDLAGTFASKTGRTLEEAQKSLQASIRAWHGSPHRFDRFSTQNIGTGEGAQAYGYGLYFADSREVAEHYRMMGAQVSVRPVDGQKLEVMAGPRGGEMKSVGTYGADEAFRVMKQQQAKFGALYEVSIAPAEDAFLLWDKPLSEQSEKVRKALEGFGGATTLDDVLAGKSIPELLAWVDGFDRNNSFDEMVEEDPSLTADDVREAIKASYDPEEMADYLGSDGFASDRTGESIYREMSSKGGGDQSASKALADAGVRGIKYLDGQSRDGKGGSFNYVVFDDADVEIVDVHLSQNGDIQGFFDPRSGLTFLVTPNLTAETAPAVLLHEATHGKQRAEIDRKAMELIETRQARSKPLRDFLFRVEQRMDAAGESGNASEAAAYIVEEAVVAGRQAGFSAVDGKLMNWIDLKFGRRVSDIVRDFVAMIRAWAMRAGVELNPTVDDLVAVAKLNVRDMARGDVTGGEGTKESRASQTASKAFRDWFGDSKAVDENGQPLVVYHGTGADIAAFDEGAVGANFGDEAGFYFTNNTRHSSTGNGKTYEDMTSAGAYAKNAEGAPNIMPAYVALQNPKIIEGRSDGGGVLSLIETPTYSAGRALLDALDEGFDGIIVRDTATTFSGQPETVVIASRPEQIKSAVGNNGNFDPTDRRINFSRAGQAAMSAPATAAQPAQAAPRAAQAQATPPDETRFQAFQRKAQDKLNRFTVIKEWLAAQGVTLSEQADVYKAEERMHSRFANKAEDFREKTVKPLIEKIQRAGYSMDDVAQYLHAQHAEERNIQVASINKQMPDGGSGMKTADANAILAAAPAELKRLANEFRAITERTKQILLDSGIISQDMADAWEATYQHYVPLKGGPEQGGKGAGKGLKANYKGKRALGHTLREEGEWIVENILADHERAIMLAEKNRVGQSLLKMAIEVGRDDLLTVGKPEKRGVLKNNTAYEVLFKGRVIGSFQSLEAARTFRATAPAAMKGASPSEFGIRKVSDPTVAYMASPMLADNEVNVYVKGQAIRVQINDELLARAYGNMGTEALGAILRVGATINGYFSKIYTGYNPEFILTNIVRDFTTGVANVTGEEGAMMALRAAKDYPASFADLFRYATTGNASQWIRMYREDGGNTGAAYLSDLERLGDEISTEYAAYKGVLANLKAGDVKSAARAAGRKAFDKTLVWVERINQAGENAMRLSIYKAMIESGKSRAEAASLAKNATVNFNRKGEVGGQMNALWLFYNAGVQGTAAIAHANLKGRHKWQARAVSAGILGLGYTMAVALGAGDDEDDYDKLSDYTKARNVVIKTGDGWLKIPVPYGYGFFWNMGRAIADAERKGEWGKAPWHVASSFIEEFTPFGAAVAGDEPDLKQFSLGVLPTLGQIPTSVANNRTTMGGPMHPESAFDKYQPDNEKMWRATKGTIPDMIAQALDQGGIEVSPETIKYLTRTFTGGAGQFVTSIGDAAWLTANGASLEVKEQPFVRKFYTETDVREARSAYYAAVAEAEKAVREGKSILKMGDHAAYGAYRVENQEFYALDRMAKARAAAIKARRNYADAIRADKSLGVKEKRDRLKAAEAQEQVIYDRYLEVFKSRTRQ